jgi:hypothetical protein
VLTDLVNLRLHAVGVSDVEFPRFVKQFLIMGQWISCPGPLDSIVGVEEKIPWSFCPLRSILDFGLSLISLFRDRFGP